MGFNIDDLLESCCDDFKIHLHERASFKKNVGEISESMNSSSNLMVSEIKQAMREYAMAVTDAYGCKSDEAMGIALKYSSLFVAAIRQVGADEAAIQVLGMFKGKNWN